jgi:hypothetical protein
MGQPVAILFKADELILTTVIYHELSMCVAFAGARET